MVIKLNQLALGDIVPPNIKNPASVKALSDAINDEFKRMVNYAESVLVYPQIHKLDNPMLDLLAEQFGVIGYSNSFSLEIKRNLVGKALVFYMKSGTVQAVEDKVASVFGDAQVEEWWEFDGEPYTFRILTNNSSANTAMYDECVRIVDSVKNVRSKLVSILINIGGKSNQYIGIVSQSAEFITATLNFEGRRV